MRLYYAKKVLLSTRLSLFESNGRQKNMLGLLRLLGLFSAGCLII
jgi:hypothetical protein